MRTFRLITGILGVLMAITIFIVSDAVKEVAAFLVFASAGVYIIHCWFTEKPSPKERYE